MTQYNFHSTDPDNFNEVKCPVIYTGLSTRVKWFISDITTNHNIVVLSPDDYIEIDYLSEIHLDKYYTAIYDNFIQDFNKLVDFPIDNLQLKKNNRGFYCFEGNYNFVISDMSYNLKQVLGFYCEKFPLTSKKDKGVWKLEAKGIGFTNFSPVWFLISNLGQPIQINKENNPWTPLFPAIVMKIQNSFTAGQPIVYANSEYISTSPPAALSNLRVKLVDANLVPIKLLNPLYVSVAVMEITDQEKQPLLEAMQMTDANAEVKKVIKETVIKYIETKNMNTQKVESGITQEPQADLLIAQDRQQLPD